jgi:uncharacterized protein
VVSPALLFIALAATPDVAHPVNDLADVLSPQAEREITQTLEQHRRDCGVQLAVLTVDTTHGEAIEDFAIRVATRWGGGEKRRDDGGLFVLAVRDHKMRIELGYGLEGRVPDATAADVLGQARTKLRAGDFDGAVTYVVNRLVGLTSVGSMSPEEIARYRAALPPRPVPRPLFEGLITFATFILASVIGRVARRRMDARIVDDDGPIGMNGQQLGLMLTMLTVVVGTPIGMLGYGWGNYWSTGIGLIAGYVFMWGSEKLGHTAAFIALLVLVTLFCRAFGDAFGKDMDLIGAAVGQLALLLAFILPDTQSDGASFGASGVTDRRRGWFDTWSGDVSDGSSSSTGSWDSSSSSSSDSSSSWDTSSSSGADWGGGGGGFGGGGASSDW